MAKIYEDGNVEIYIRQLISEALGNDVDSQKQATDEKLLKELKLIKKISFLTYRKSTPLIP